VVRLALSTDRLLHDLKQDFHRCLGVMDPVRN